MFSDPTDSRDPGHEGEKPTEGNLRREFEVFKANGGRGRLLSLCRECLNAIPPSSVQPERDFSVLRQVLGENRARLKSSTLDDIFVLKKAFLHKAT